MPLQRPGDVNGRDPAGRANRYAKAGFKEPITLILGQAPRGRTAPRGAVAPCGSHGPCQRGWLETARLRLPFTCGITDKEVLEKRGSRAKCRRLEPCKRRRQVNQTTYGCTLQDP
jgi:hypothetical protein